jgi:lysozyme family protein
MTHYTDSQFLRHMDRLLSHEGGYVNNPNDPGGETNWGISKRTYPLLHIRSITRDQAIAIYRRDFWEKLRADQVPASFAFQLLDAAVNSGTDRAIKWMQQVIGVQADGRWGPKTQAALNAFQPADLVLLYLAIRLEFMTETAKWPFFSKGWARRIAQNLRYAAEDN